MFVAFEVLRKRPAVFEDRGDFLVVERDDCIPDFFQRGEFPLVRLIREILFLSPRFFRLHSFFRPRPQDLLEEVSAVPVNRLAVMDDLLQRFQRERPRHLRQALVDRVRDARVVQGAVRGGEQDSQLLAERAQVVPARGGHQHRGQRVRVNDAVQVERVRFLQKSQVEADVVPDHGRVPHEGRQFMDDAVQPRRPPHHRIVNAGQAGDEFGNMLAGVDQRGKFVFHAFAVKTHRADLDDRVAVLVQTCGFDIYCDNGCHNRTSVP
ncbi:MAG: hypothetical protein PGMFKBFP_00398 [Anaerolineales bacterium]|nr:hypothetical protein [Anaerolineales bacterium]